MDEEKQKLIPYYKTVHLAATVNDVANGTMAGYLPDSIRRELREAAEILRHVVLLRSRQCLSGDDFRNAFVTEEGFQRWLSLRMTEDAVKSIRDSKNADEAFKFSGLMYDTDTDLYSKEMDFMIVLQPDKEEN